MIPATNKKVLVAEDWKKIYQSFRNADFKSYDFDTLRRTMISYLRENFPEDFNDYIDSSEFIAIIDIIAYLGQNLSFRIDLNARENFLETAQRRDSILRLAQLISYNPARNIPASGLLKLTSILTTDSVIDANGTNLANTIIVWNDITNPDWYQQFINIMNSAMNSEFGKPNDRKTIDGILTELYTINSSNADVPVYSFNKSINGTSMTFEVVSPTFSEKDYVYESPPEPGKPLNLLFRNDNQGSSSPNSGFFAFFKQGSINVSRFVLDSPVPNEIVGVNVSNINDTDVWLWQLDKGGAFSTLWSPVQTASGSNNNVIYNSLNKNIRSIYAITSRDEDQIDLNFSDGVFGDLPKGEFRLFYRQSNGLTYTIKPNQMGGITISVPYKNTSGQEHTLELTLSLQYSVSNSSGPESNASIQLKAPQSYYTQNRMITGEDYNIAPLAAGSDILKIKSINRVSSGISKYFELSDVSGKYSSTNIFADDGILYQDYREKFFEFEPTSRNQILGVIKNNLSPIVNSPYLKSFYYEKYERFDAKNQNVIWNEVNKTPSQSRGYLRDSSGAASVGNVTTTILSQFVPGALVKFDAPQGFYFDKRNTIKKIPSNNIIPAGGKFSLWSSVIKTTDNGLGDGTGILSDGTGAIILGTRVSTNSILSKIIPPYLENLGFALETEIANNCISQRNFGLTINKDTREWEIILGTNLDLLGTWDLSNQGNFEDAGIDASWIIAFVWEGTKYTVRYRTLTYVFESNKQTSFFVENSTVNFDFVTNTVIKDKIDVLGINAKPNQSIPLGADITWQIDGPVVEEDGFIDPKKVIVSFYDRNNSGQVDNPDSFLDIVDPFSIDEDTTYRNKFVYFKKTPDGLRYELTNDPITAFPNEIAFHEAFPDKNTIPEGSLYYFYDPEIDIVAFWCPNPQALVYLDTYIGKPGRSDIKFQYQHNSPEERRIDPSKSNIIDIYILNLSYDKEFRSWLIGNSNEKPLPPTSQNLEQNYGEKLELIKSISDEIVFHPVKYKILFGNKAPTTLQASFKAVKNTARPTSNSDLRSRILSAINDFFALENWEFGQSFYFSELSAYVMNRLTPDITNFIIVPKSGDFFGSLYEIACQSDEIFINDTSVEDIEIVDAIPVTQPKKIVVKTSGTSQALTGSIVGFGRVLCAVSATTSASITGTVMRIGGVDCAFSGSSTGNMIGLGNTQPAIINCGTFRLSDVFRGRQY